MTRPQNKKLHDYSRQIAQCVKCGVCQAHCPAYRLSRKEGDVARGKVALAASLIDGKVGVEKCLEQDFSMCLMCGSCVNKCPNKVPTHEIVGAVRREISDNKGLSFISKSVTSVVRSNSLKKTLAKGGALVSPLVLKKVPRSSGLRLRIQSPVMRDRTVPKLQFKNLFDLTPSYLEGNPEKPVIGFFAGCSLTYIYPEVGLSLVQLLQKLGYSIHIPREQSCCGIPALSAGDGATVEKLAENNVAAFGRYGETEIITACASCFGGVGEHYGSMTGVAPEFAEKVVDFTVFLKSMGFIDKLAAETQWKKRTKVTYHDPCHLKMQGITREPRELLQAMPNVDFVEMEDASLCCGLGGTFSVSHYDCSKSIGAVKMVGLQESGAEKIATACPGCIMQLQDTINHAGLEVESVHLLDLLNECVDELNGKKK